MVVVVVVCTMHPDRILAPREPTSGDPARHACGFGPPPIAGRDRGAAELVAPGQSRGMACAACAVELTGYKTWNDCHPTHMPKKSEPCKPVAGPKDSLLRSERFRRTQKALQSLVANLLSRPAETRAPPRQPPGVQPISARPPSL